MTSIISVLDDAAGLATKEFTIANASQSGRVVALIAAQNRGPANVSTATLNGVAPTGVTVGRNATNTSVGTLVAYWSDADLPSAAGTYGYTINDPGPATCIFELSGWDEVAPEVIDQSFASGSGPQNITFTGSNAGSVLLLAAANFDGVAFDAVSGQTIEYAEAKEAVVSKVDAANDGFIVLSFGFSDMVATAIAFNSASGTDYTIRKGSTATITHTLTAGGITSATLNGQAVTIASQSGQTADISFTDTITTSGVYDLVLGDGVETQTLSVQYNIIGLTANTIQKDGASIGARTDLELDVLDAAGATVLGKLTGLTTDAEGITGQTIVPAGAVDDAVRVSGYSEAAGIGFAYKTTLGLL